MSYSVIRSHEICAGHRVVGHESKCRHLHGHNYVFHFKVQPTMQDQVDDNELDHVGRVIDFSVVKSTLCEWLEQNWDHKFLHWEKDGLIFALTNVAGTSQFDASYADGEGSVDEDQAAKDRNHFFDSLVSLPFNPTAENLAAYMVDVIGPRLLDDHGVELVECTIEETSKCHVTYEK